MVKYSNILILIFVILQLFSNLELKITKSKLLRKKPGYKDEEILTEEVENQIINGELFDNLGFDSQSFSDEFFNSITQDEMDSTEMELSKLEFEKCFDKFLDLDYVSDDQIKECEDMKVKNCNALSSIQKSLYYDCMEIEGKPNTTIECAQNFSSEGCPGYIPIDKCKDFIFDHEFIKCNNDFCLSVKDKGNLFCMNLENKKLISEKNVFCSKNNYQNWRNEKCGGYVPNECSTEYNKEKCNKFCSDKASKFEYNEFCKYMQLSDKQSPECKLNPKAKGCLGESPLEDPEFAIKSNTPENIKAWNNKVIDWCKTDNRTKTSFVCYTIISELVQLKDSKKKAEILMKIDKNYKLK